MKRARAAAEARRKKEDDRRRSQALNCIQCAVRQRTARAAFKSQKLQHTSTLVAIARKHLEQQAAAAASEAEKRAEEEAAAAWAAALAAKQEEEAAAAAAQAQQQVTPLQITCSKPMRIIKIQFC
jgi:hypothetical protein